MSEEYSSTEERLRALDQAIGRHELSHAPASITPRTPKPPTLPISGTEKLGRKVLRWAIAAWGVVMFLLFLIIEERPHSPIYWIGLIALLTVALVGAYWIQIFYLEMGKGVLRQLRRPKDPES